MENQEEYNDFYNVPRSRSPRGLSVAIILAIILAAVIGGLFLCTVAE